MKHLFLTCNRNCRLNSKYFLAFRLDECNYYDIDEEYDIYLKSNAYTCTGYCGHGDVDGSYSPGSLTPDPPGLNPSTLGFTKVGTADCIDKSRFLLDDVDEMLCYLESGLSKDDFTEIIEEIYENENIDYENDYFAFYLFEFQDK